MRTAALVVLLLDVSLVLIGFVRMARGSNARSDAAGNAMARAYTIIGTLIAGLLLVPAGLLVLASSALLVALVLGVLALPLALVTAGAG